MAVLSGRERMTELRCDQLLFACLDVNQKPKYFIIFDIFQHWQHMPNYAVLVDTRDRSESQTTYVPEENLEIITNTKVGYISLFGFPV